MATASYDVAVIGGGLVGAATAWGLARLDQRVVVLDEGDDAYRASRGNFALVWVQSKGLGLPAYAEWTRQSSDRWSELASLLREQSGIDVAFSRPGGFTLCLSDEQLERRVAQMQRLHNSLPPSALPYEVLDHTATAKALPQIGPDVVGSVFCPLDGHVNSLRLLRALHAGLPHYLPNFTVTSIKPGFVIEGSGQRIEAGKIVLAAGLGNARLAPLVGIDAPVRPQRGQILVTEKLAPFLHHPIVNVRQTDEGGVLLSGSQEEAGFDEGTTMPVISAIAQRAIKMFPLLLDANIVRAWSALRVMSPDGFPIYQQSAQHPGAFLLTCHSGVTLAAAHALCWPAISWPVVCPISSRLSAPTGSMFRRLPDDPRPVVRLSFDGRTIEARQGDSVAAALLANGVASFRTTPVSDSPRGPYCLMGTCFDCLVSIDGVANRQACMTPAREGMAVLTQHGKKQL